MQDYLESKNIALLEGNFGFTAGNTRIIGLLLCCVHHRQNKKMDPFYAPLRLEEKWDL